MSLLEEIQEEMKSFTYAHDFKLAEIEAELLSTSALVAENTRMREELRVSCFAQELRTPYPVSIKRLDKVWQQLQN